jgi:NTP pyrophosphatase (non-canonical NTP hydrolase)
VVAHLKKEVDELAESHDPEEAADCLILLLHHAHKCGYDLMIEAFKKFEINRQRRWGRPDEDGVVEHIREDPVGPNGPPFPEG